jgi:DUF1680 family protein
VELAHAGVSGDARHADVMNWSSTTACFPGWRSTTGVLLYERVAAVRPDLPMMWLDTPSAGPTRPAQEQELRAYCCPPVRTVASLHEYAYGVSDGAVWVSHGASTLELDRPRGAKLRLRQETRYPWKAIRLKVEQSDGSEWTLKPRIPG